MPRATMDHGRVEIDGLSLEAPGVRGAVQVERGAARGPIRRGLAAGVGQSSTSLDRALRRQGMRTSKTAILDGTRALPRGDRKPEPLVLRVKAPRRGREQVVLTIENGVATWHMSREAGARGAALTASPTRTYVIPQVRPPETAAARGFSLSSIIQVITFPISHVVGEAAQFAARRWDTEHHPPQVRAYGPDFQLTELSAADRARLSAGRTLLFVHGTFSTTEGAFNRLPAETMEALHRRYEGRVIAYDHPTIADDPSVNARTFYDIVGDLPMEIDIVCHSRGGLVARSIAERPGDLAPLGPRIKVRQIVLVGVVNQGTILADAEHWGELLDRFTTMLALLPGPGISADARNGPRGRQVHRDRDRRGPRGAIRHGTRQRVPAAAQYRACGSGRRGLPGDHLELRATRPGSQGVAERRGPGQAVRRQVQRHDGDHREHGRREWLGALPDQARLDSQPSSRPTRSSIPTTSGRTSHRRRCGSG